MIDRFQGQYRFLSNFWIEPDGSCVELEYQAAKCQRPEDYVKFDGLTAGQAKRMGRQIEIRSDWEKVKLSVMFDLVSRKFMDHPSLCSLLAATGDQELVEGNDWGDRFWGVCRGSGENHLGKILMQVRSVTGAH